MTSVYLAKNVIKCREQHWKKNDVVERPGDHTMRFVFDNKMINYQCIWLKFYQHVEHLLFYISYKICKQSLMSIDFIASVYELFDNPSYFDDFFFVKKKYCKNVPVHTYYIYVIKLPY